MLIKYLNHTLLYVKYFPFFLVNQIQIVEQLRENIQIKGNKRIK